MTWTFDVSTNIGKLRALIGDTDTSSQRISDEELQVFLDQTSNDLLLSAAYACRNLATKYAFLGGKKSAGNYSEDNSGIGKAFLDMAKNFQEMAESIPADAQSEIIYNGFNYLNILHNKALRGESLDD